LAKLDPSLYKGRWKAMNDFMNTNFDLFGKRSANAAEASQQDILAGFTPREMADLLRVRSAFTRGRYSESTPEFKRLLFARWLVEHGRLSG
jgi:hypothetical protein